MAEIKRQKVKSPFALGPRPGTKPMHRPDLASRALPRSAFVTGQSKGQYIVDSLINFAGIAGSQYVKTMDKKLEADKAVQTSRAVQGLAPTSESTIAGYRAHAAVNVKNQTLASQARLNEVASTRHTDEEWEQAIQDEYKALDDYMLEAYDKYATDQEIQKLSFNALREVIPQATAQREANKVAFDIEDRIQSATDTLINASKVQHFLDVKGEPKAADKYVNTLFSSLKLTESQKDNVLINAIKDTRDSNLIELSKIYKGQRKTSLFERTGAIQKLEKQLLNEQIADDSINLAVERRGLEESYLDGVLSDKELIDKVKLRNKSLNNRFMTPAQLDSLMDKRDKNRAAEYRQREIMASLADPTKTDMSLYKKKEVQGGLNAIFSTYLDQAHREADKIEDEGERNKFIAQKRKAAIQRVGDMAVKVDAPLDAWVSELNNLANLNIPANILEQPVGEFQIEQLPPVAQTAIEKLETFSVTARDEFLDALGGREAKTLRMFQHLRDMDTPLPQALDKAQRAARNPVPLDVKAVEKGVEEVRSNQEFSWFRPDYPSNQEAYLEQEIRNKISIDPIPDSERNIETVTDWMDNKWTTAGHLRLKGSPAKLQKAMGINVDKMEYAMTSLVNSQRSKIMPMLYGLGLEMKDVFPVTDVERGTIQLRTSGGDYVGAPMPLKDVRKITNQWKVEQEKRASEYEVKHKFNILGG